MDEYERGTRIGKGMVDIYFAIPALAEKEAPRLKGRKEKTSEAMV